VIPFDTILPALSNHVCKRVSTGMVGEVGMWPILSYFSVPVLGARRRAAWGLAFPASLVGAAASGAMGWLFLCLHPRDGEESISLYLGFLCYLACAIAIFAGFAQCAFLE
jgi:hypothetical protein